MRNEPKSMIGLVAAVASVLVVQVGWAQDSPNGEHEPKQAASQQDQGQPDEAAETKTEQEPSQSGEKAADKTKESDKETSGQSSASGDANTSEQTSNDKPEKEQNCNDGADNDGDGVVDCADSDCVSLPSCQAPAPSAPPPVSQPSSPQPSTAPASADQTGALTTGEATAQDSPGMDQGASGDEEGFKPYQKSFSLEGLVGVSSRLGGTATGNVVDQRAGLQLGTGLFYAPDRGMAFGLSYRYTQLGQEQEGQADPQGAGKRLQRRLHTIELAARWYPYRTARFRAWTGLELGVTIETGSADGARISQQYPVTAVPYQVDMEPNAGLAAGAALGVDYDLSRRTALLGSVGFTEHVLSSDPQPSSDPGVYVSGLGSTPQLDFRLALQYRFEVTGTPAPVSGTVQMGRR